MLTYLDTTYNIDVASNHEQPIPRLIASNNQAELLQTFASLINIDKFEIQYFNDSKYGATDSFSVSVLSKKLNNLNDKNEKFNVGFRRNQARKKIQANGWYSFVIEYDDLDKELQIPLIEKICRENNLQLPTILLGTGNKSFHFYWTLETPIDLNKGAELQARFLQLFTDKDGKYKADDKFKSVVQPSRLPGFKHLKTGKLSELYIWSGEKYSYEQLDNALPQLEKPEKAPKRTRSPKPEGFKVEKKARVVSYNTEQEKKNLINEYYDLTSRYNCFGRRSENIQKDFKQHLKNISNAEQGTVHATLLSESRKIFGLVFVGLNINKAFDELYKVTEKRVSQQADGDIEAAYRTINSALRYAIDNICDDGYLVEKPVIKFDADVEINEQYLPSNILQYLEDTRILAIKSAIGTGKTTLIKELIEINSDAYIKEVARIIDTRIKNNPLERIIILLHRRSLIKNFDDILRKYGFITYDDYSITQYGALSYHDRLIITYDSLHKLTNEYNQHFSYDLMITDECDQAFDHLVQGKTEIAKDRLKAINIFTSLISSSKNVILTSATLSNDEISFISNFTQNGRADIKTVLNVHKPIIHDFIQYIDKEIILKKLNAFIRKNKKIAIACNSKAEAEGLHELLSSKHENAKIALLTPDTFDKNIEVVNALINADLSLDDDVVIYTPVLGTGYNIDRIHFDYVFGIFNKIDALAASDLLQMCGRVRAPISNEIHVYVQEGCIGNEIDVNKIRASFNKICPCPTRLDESKREIVSINPTVNNAQLEYLSKCIARKNISLLNLSSNFWHLVKQDGHTITLEDRRDKSKRNTEKIKEIKKEHKQKNIQNIVDAKDINSIEKNKLDNKVNKTKDEKSSIDKYFFKYSTGFDQPTEADITWYEQKGGKKACKNIELQLMPLEVAQIKDFDEKYIEGKKTQPDFSNFTKRKILLDELLKLIDASKDESGIMCEASLQTSGFTQYAETCIDKIKIFLGFTPDLKKPMRTAKAVLRLIGLEIKGKKCTCDGQEIRVYHVTKDSQDRREQIIKSIQETRLRQWHNELRGFLCNPKYKTCADVPKIASFINKINVYLKNAEVYTV